MIIRSLYNTASQMNVLQKKQENSAANTANVNTPGFKYQELVQRTMKEYEVKNHTGGLGNNEEQKLGSINFGTEIDEAYTHFSQGILKETGTPTDLAISGEGFFAVQMQNGQTGYTRSGNFRIDGEKRLVTQEGFPVFGIDAQNNVSPIMVENDFLSIDNKGMINGTEKRVMIVDFADYTALEQKGNSIYAGQGTNLVADQAVSQGYLEGSNVNLLDEMVKMIEVSREFESNQRTLKAIDETLQKAVNEIGRN
ncbi:MAG: flagellar hook-basal body complex protein [Clostridiaceae bacterium]